jgi:hypothetical protein
LGEAREKGSVIVLFLIFCLRGTAVEQTTCSLATGAAADFAFFDPVLRFLDLGEGNMILMSLRVEEEES